MPKTVLFFFIGKIMYMHWFDKTLEGMIVFKRKSRFGPKSSFCEMPKVLKMERSQASQIKSVTFNGYPTKNRLSSTCFGSYMILDNVCQREVCMK